MPFTKSKRSAVIAKLRSCRLHTQSQFKQVTRHGKRIHTKSLLMKWIESPDGVSRFCFIARKKNGNAVYRNRCRRILRPLFQKLIPCINPPVWAMVFVNDNVSEMTSQRLSESSNLIFEKMNWVSL